MTDLFDTADAAATPLTIEGMRDLIPAHIAFRSERNAAEQENILRAQDWALNRRRDPLTEKFVLDLHRRMLGDVWRWAGKFRISKPFGSRPKRKKLSRSVKSSGVIPWSGAPNAASAA